MKYLLFLLIFCFATPPKSTVIVRVNDFEGGEAQARIEIYENHKRIQKNKVWGSHTYFLKKGTYRLLAIACDTVETKINVWNKEHEFWVTVKECE